MPIPLIVPIVLGAAALFGLNGCGDEPEQPQQKEVLPEIPKNCGNYDRSQELALRYYIMGVQEYNGNFDFNSSNFTDGKPVLGFFPGRVTYDSSGSLVDANGNKYKTMTEFYVKRIEQHQCLTGIKPKTVLVYAALSWQGNTALPVLRPAELVKDMVAIGITPFVKFDLLDWQYNLQTSDYRSKHNGKPMYYKPDVAAGQYDAIPINFFTQLAQINGKILLALDSEANSTAVWDHTDANVGNTPEYVRAAHRHIWDLADKFGASNLIPVYVPNAHNDFAPCSTKKGETTCSIDSLSAFYPWPSKPGEKDYIKMILPDVYAWVVDSRECLGWKTFAETAKPTFNYLRQAFPNKEFGIGEIGASPLCGLEKKGAWILDAQKRLPEAPYKTRVVYWFQANIEANWSVY